MSERYIPEHRRTQFKAKNTFKPEELRRRREEQQVEIRKQKREENLAKRRGIGTGADRPGASLGAAPDSDDENPPTESQVCLFPVHQHRPRWGSPALLPSRLNRSVAFCEFPPTSYPAACFDQPGPYFGPAGNGTCEPYNGCHDEPGWQRWLRSWIRAPFSRLFFLAGR